MLKCLNVAVIGVVAAGFVGTLTFYGAAKDGTGLPPAGSAEKGLADKATVNELTVSSDADEECSSSTTTSSLAAAWAEPKVSLKDWFERLGVSDPANLESYFHLLPEEITPGIDRLTGELGFYWVSSEGAANQVNIVILSVADEMIIFRATFNGLPLSGRLEASASYLWLTVSSDSRWQIFRPFPPRRFIFGATDESAASNLPPGQTLTLVADTVCRCCGAGGAGYCEEQDCSMGSGCWTDSNKQTQIPKAFCQWVTVRRGSGRLGPAELLSLLLLIGAAGREVVRWR